MASYMPSQLTTFHGGIFVKSPQYLRRTIAVATGLLLLPTLVQAQTATAPAITPATTVSPTNVPVPPSRFTFTDNTDSSGLYIYARGALNHAVVWTDLDGDNLLDLFLGNFSDRPNPTRKVPSQIFRQTAPGRFAEVNAPAVQTLGRTSGGVFADLDNDGDMELYVSNNTLPSDYGKRHPHRMALVEPSALYRNDGGKFVNISKESGTVENDVYNSRDATPIDYDNDGLLDLLVVSDNVYMAHGSVRLYRNLGNLRFRDVTTEVGIDRNQFGFGVATGDVNGDGMVDFFLGGSHRLYISNASTHKFSEASHLNETFMHRSSVKEDFATGCDMGDIDNDGDIDIITGTHFARSSGRVFINEGAGADGKVRFREITKEIGIPETLPNKPATCQIVDFDQDGLPDIYWSVWVTEIDGRRTPYVLRGLGIQDGIPRFEVPSLAGIVQRTRRPRNADNSRNNNGTPPAAAQAPAATAPGTPDTAAPSVGAEPTVVIAPPVAQPVGRRGAYYVDGPAVDFDGDGDIDISAGAWTRDSVRLFRNDTADKGNWLQVKVIGTKMNRMGIGAQIRAYAPGTRQLLGYRYLNTNGGYSGSRPPIAHFGLAKHALVDLEVTLPSRLEPLRFADVNTNQFFTVREP
jgi:hypothetical protein